MQLPTWRIYLAKPLRSLQAWRRCRPAKDSMAQKPGVRRQAMSQTWVIPLFRLKPKKKRLGAKKCPRNIPPIGTKQDIWREGLKLKAANFFARGSSYGLSNTLLLKYKTQK